jgi:hypothetical protein
MLDYRHARYKNLELSSPKTATSRHLAPNCPGFSPRAKASSPGTRAKMCEVQQRSDCPLFGGGFSFHWLCWGYWICLAVGVGNLFCKLMTMRTRATFLVASPLQGGYRPDCVVQHGGWLIYLGLVELRGWTKERVRWIHRITDEQGADWS